MALRELVDARGVQWRVWEVNPAVDVLTRLRRRADLDVDPHRRLAPTAASAERRVHGWLVFESAGGERRRLAPIPTAWPERLSDVDVLVLLARAERVPGSRTARVNTDVRSSL